MLHLFFVGVHSCSSWLAFLLGKWTPQRVNEVFRLCKYTAPSHGFAPHRDANFVAMDPRERSVLTVMVYLNDAAQDFQGGETLFYETHDQDRKPGETAAEEMQREQEKYTQRKP